MTLTSPVFTNNQIIPEKYTCDGEDISPLLMITDVLPEAKSLTLIVDDPDAPRGDWVHWTVFNIPPETSDIDEGTIPSEATEGVTDFGHPGYGGPCPPSGIHSYRFKLFALDGMLDLDELATKQDIQSAMKGHIIDSVELVGTYARSQ